MKINLYDANSHVRRLLEADKTGRPLRTLLFEVNTSSDVEVFVWDGAKGNDRRRALYAPYKTNRTPMAEDIFAFLQMSRDLLRHTKAIQITVNGYEADDAIAALCSEFCHKTPVSIHSTDRDLVALCALPGVRHDFQSLAKVAPGQIRLFKSTVGDPSDNIPGIKGFGQKAWENCDQDELRSWFEGGSRLSDDPEQIMDAFRLTKACANWLIANQDLARTFWTIVGFMPPTPQEIEKGTRVGVKNDAAAFALLERFMQ